MDVKVNKCLPVPTVTTEKPVKWCWQYIRCRY